MKRARRQEREGLRELLKFSKEVTKKLHPCIDIKINRYKVSKMRANIRKMMDADDTLSVA